MQVKIEIKSSCRMKKVLILIYIQVRDPLTTQTRTVGKWTVPGSLVKTIRSIELPDTANLDCYHDQFEEKNLTTLMIGQRSNKIDVNRFSFLGNIEMNGNDICVGIGFWKFRLSG